MQFCSRVKNSQTAKIWKYVYSSCSLFSSFAGADLFSSYFSVQPACVAEGGWSRFVFWLLTSLISFILAPPFPMREPHWLAGMTSRRVTGGLELMVPLATSAVRSWRVIQRTNQTAEVKVEIRGEISHWGVVTPTIRTELSSLGSIWDSCSNQSTP